MKNIIMPLPSFGFDPTEAAIPWKVLSEAGHRVHFATPTGQIAEADTIMVTGRKLGIWKPVLRAGKDAVAAYQKMAASDAFRNPLAYDALGEDIFDALILAGGHDKGMREFLESEILQALVAAFFAKEKPVGAICHGVILAARSMNAQSGKSVLHGYTTTCLLRSQEMLAYNMTRLWMKDYYRTYPDRTVESEVRGALASPDDFIEGPSPLHRDGPNKMRHGFAVRDRHYVSARWPGDAYNFCAEFEALL